MPVDISFVAAGITNILTEQELSETVQKMYENRLKQGKRRSPEGYAVTCL